MRRIWVAAALVAVSSISEAIFPQSNALQHAAAKEISHAD
jgi:hypothetical protein